MKYSIFFVCLCFKMLFGTEGDPEVVPDLLSHEMDVQFKSDITLPKVEVSTTNLSRFGDVEGLPSYIIERLLLQYGTELNIHKQRLDEIEKWLHSFKLYGYVGVSYEGITTTKGNEISFLRDYNGYWWQDFLPGSDFRLRKRFELVPVARLGKDYTIAASILMRDELGALPPGVGGGEVMGSPTFRINFRGVYITKSDAMISLFFGRFAEKWTPFTLFHPTEGSWDMEGIRFKMRTDAFGKFNLLFAKITEKGLRERWTGYGSLRDVRDIDGDGDTQELRYDYFFSRYLFGLRNEQSLGFGKKSNLSLMFLRTEDNVNSNPELKDFFTGKISADKFNDTDGPLIITDLSEPIKNTVASIALEGEAEITPLSKLLNLPVNFLYETDYAYSATDFNVLDATEPVIGSVINLLPAIQFRHKKERIFDIKLTGVYRRLDPNFVAVRGKGHRYDYFTRWLPNREGVGYITSGKFSVFSKMYPLIEFKTQHIFQTQIDPEGAAFKSGKKQDLTNGWVIGGGGTYGGIWAYGATVPAKIRYNSFNITWQFNPYLGLTLGYEKEDWERWGDPNVANRDLETTIRKIRVDYNRGTLFSHVEYSKVEFEDKVLPPESPHNFFANKRDVISFLAKWNLERVFRLMMILRFDYWRRDDFRRYTIDYSVTPPVKIPADDSYEGYLGKIELRAQF